jgi:hypothetical protein
LPASSADKTNMGKEESYESGNVEFLRKFCGERK